MDQDRRAFLKSAGCAIVSLGPAVGDARPANGGARRDFRRPMAPLLPLPSETSARPTGSSQKNLHGLPCSWKGDRRQGWRNTHDLLSQRATRISSGS
jgi:hypothetical protein